MTPTAARVLEEIEDEAVYHPRALREQDGFTGAVCVAIVTYVVDLRAARAGRTRRGRSKQAVYAPVKTGPGRAER